MSRRLPNVLAHLMLTFLVIQIGWFGGQWTWRLIWPQDVVVGMPQTPRDGGSTAQRIRPGDLTFFGRRENAGHQISSVARVTATETGLRLTLHGVFLAAQGERSSAILSGDRRSADLYHVGDPLPGNAELVAVEPRRILLRRNGEIESLTFEDGLAIGRVAGSGREGAEDDGAFLARANRALEQDPGKALASAGFRPHDDGPGYVYDGSNERLAGTNLQPGDVIISINGRELGDVESDRERLEGWLASDSLRLEIERGGTRFSFTVPVP